MGKMVRWTKERGWEIGPTPYEFRLMGLYEFRRRFSGSRAWYNRPHRRSKPNKK